MKHKLVMPDEDTRSARIVWSEQKGDVLELCIMVDHDAPAPWLPIETAPKDGTLVLFAGEFDRPGDWRIKMGYWDSADNDWRLFGGSWPPTRWQPLPPPPADRSDLAGNN